MEVSTRARSALAVENPARLLLKSDRCAVGTHNDFTNCRRKIIDPRTGNDDGVSTAMRFLGNSQEFAPIIFPEFDVKMLPLDLQLFRLDDVIHFLRSRRVWRLRHDKESTKFHPNVTFAW